MFANFFANLSKVGKALMLPIASMPAAGILLGIGSAQFGFIPPVVSELMAEAGARSSVTCRLSLRLALLSHLPTMMVLVQLRQVLVITY